MNDIWRVLPLSESPVAIIDGDRGVEYPKKSDFHSAGDWLFLDTGNVRADGFEFSSCQFILSAKEQKLRKGRVSRNDIVLTTRGTIGNVGFYSARVAYPRVRINSGMVVLRADPNELLPEFLFQIVRSIQFRAQIRALTSGAAQPQLPIRDIKLIEIPIPPVPQQAGIASILGAYDDLIEVNRRRIALLEEMARRLFDEPGHEGHAIIETAEGPVPKKWSIRPLHAMVEFVRGRSYRSVDLVEIGGVPFVNLKCFLRDGGFRESGLKRYSGSYNANQLLQHGDIVMAVTDMTQERRIVGQAARIPLLDELPAVHSMDLIKIVPLLGVSSVFLYHWLRYSDFSSKAAQRANGANVLHLSPSAIANFPILVPDENIQTLFERHVGSINQQCDALQAAEKRLIASRDLLLPRLISGELSVHTAEPGLDAVA